MWICYDAFGAEVSSRAQRIYDWGLKAPWGGGTIEPARANAVARAAFIEEVQRLVGLLNRQLPADGTRLEIPDPRSSRDNLPTAEDERRLQEIFRNPSWIAPGNSATAA
jgi:hypothetical protein